MNLFSYLKIPETWKKSWKKKMLGGINRRNEKSREYGRKDDDKEKEKLREENKNLKRKLKLVELNARVEKAQMQKKVKMIKRRARSEEQRCNRMVTDYEDNLTVLLEEHEARAKKQGKREYEAFIKKYCCVFPRNSSIFLKYPKFQELVRTWTAWEHNTIKELRAELREKELIIENHVPIAEGRQNYKLVEQLHEAKEKAWRAGEETRRMAYKLSTYQQRVEYEGGAVDECDSTTDDDGNPLYPAPGGDDSDADDAEYDDEDLEEEIEGEEFEGDYEPDDDANFI